MQAVGTFIKQGDDMQDFCLVPSHDGYGYDPMAEVREKTFGGIVDCHGHPLTERTSTREMYLTRSENDFCLEDVWGEIGKIRLEALKSLPARLRQAIFFRKCIGISKWQVYVDFGPGIGFEAIEICIAMKNAVNKYGFDMKIAAYPTEGLTNPEMILMLRQVCTRAEVEVVGLLPSRDRPKDRLDDPVVAHDMECAFEIAAEFGKAIDMQVDQKNHPEETETLLLAGLAKRYREKGYKKPIGATHCLSMSSWKDIGTVVYVLDMMAKNNVSMIVCPRATLDNKQIRWVMSPTHNSIAPWELALKRGVNVALGIDNVLDMYMPWCDGDIWKDVSVLVHSVRYHGSIERIAEILTVNGNRALGRRTD